VVMVRLKFVENVKEAVTFIEQGRKATSHLLQKNTTS